MSSKHLTEGLVTRSNPFPNWISEHLQFDPNSDSTYCEFEKGSKLYELCCNYIVKQTNQSFIFSPKENTSDATEILEKLAREVRSKQNNDNKKEEEEENKDKDNDNDNDNDDHIKKSKVVTHLGLGVHEFKYLDQSIYALHQTIGLPVAGGWSCANPPMHCSLIIFVQKKKQLNFLENFLSFIIEENDTKHDNLFVTIYRWHIEYQYWQKCAKKISRDPNTIILPQETYINLSKDIERFLDYNTIKWYFKHGIPYKRSYLFHGVPGSGKSSLIQSLAAKYNRNLCFLQPTNPKMTDDLFKECISKAPKNSFVVLEDIDALFTKKRKKKDVSCPLTFSGLLNGLDGIGIPDGQIFILTTNFVNRLDNALIRAGRVDLHLEFPLATNEQIRSMYHLFYPNSDKKYGDLFLSEIRKCFKKGISMSAIQQHFIMNMLETDEIIIKNVPDLGKRLDVMSQIKKKEKKDKKKKEKEENKDEENEENEEEDNDNDSDSDEENEEKKKKKKNNDNNNNQNSSISTAFLVAGFALLFVLQI